MEGTKPKSTVSSELAAMFSHVVLPTLQRHYYDEHNPNWRMDYQKRCYNFAKDMGLPENQRHKITLPCYISMDWDTKHTWVRQFIAMPGRSASARAEVEDNAFDLHLGTSSATPRPLSSTDAATNLFESLDPPSRAAHLDKAARLHQQQDVNDRRRHHQRQFEETCGHNMVDIALCCKATFDSDFVTIIPQQIMPLSKVSPDIHSPVEHMVGTIKRYVKDCLLDSDLNDTALWKGRTYQDFVNAAVMSRGNGPDGIRHVSKSVEKQKIICEILAADAGHKFNVQYTFGDPGPRKKTEHQVEGTAGGWIRVTKWT